MYDLYRWGGTHFCPVTYGGSTLVWAVLGDSITYYALGLNRGVILATVGDKETYSVGSVCLVAAARSL
jgi:hypothetical protein